MTLKYPKLGIARFPRTCPACDQLIDAGSPIAWQGRTWVHPGCFFDPRLKRADAQLQAAFLATVS